ncbi:IS66 family transposase [Enterocloster citroniae]|nr:transposase [Enterocloster citroniae]
MNQEKYLKVFLTDGKVPIDNSTSERSIRTFCIGKKELDVSRFHSGSAGKRCHLQYFGNRKAQ